MSPEKEKILCQKYSKIFRQTIESNEPIDIWGFECGDGWFELIDTLCNNVQSHIDWKSKNVQDTEELENLQVVAQQVKEKFGGLRFYVVGGDETTKAYINFAESFSMKICESCGNPGRQQRAGWIHTACDPCFQNRSWRVTKL